MRAAKPLTAPPAAKSPDDLAHARAVHGAAVPSAIYGSALTTLLGEEFQAESITYARDAITRMAPRDAAEEMLIVQLLLTHARVMRLTTLANQASAAESLRILNEYADRASNTYRRLMLALAEYRRPPRTGDTFAVVKQANIASQQVIQNHENTTRNATNEQGSAPHEHPHYPHHPCQPSPPVAKHPDQPAPTIPAPTPPPRLSPHSAGPRVTPGVSQA
ncbi:MAG: hypothetical protein ACK55O_02975 [Phycisphaerales bacterium]|jgi:hypothetical protein|nr:hypothetical protein [Phycisphaeraceae bacterium]